jgi:hypothetical protein
MNVGIFFLQIALLLGLLTWARQHGFLALVLFIAGTLLGANLCVVQPIELGGIQSTAAEAFSVGALLGVGILSRDHGPNMARQGARLALVFVACFAVWMQSHLLYESPLEFGSIKQAFHLLFTWTPRFVVASWFSFWLSQLSLRVWLAKSCPLWLGVWLAEGFDSALFSVFGLWGQIPQLWQVTLFSWALKSFVLACMLPWIRARKDSAV